MSTIKEENNLKPPIKKLRFRGDSSLHPFENRIEDIFDDNVKGKNRNGDLHNEDSQQKGKYKNVSQSQI